MDIVLDRGGDIAVSEAADISVKHGIVQAVRIRLQWFFGEWRFAPDFGVPYWEEVFIKNPNAGRIRRIVRDRIMSVREVRDARNITVELNNRTRRARISFECVVDGETYREEVEFNV